VPNSFIFSFEELPLVIVNGIEAAFINGQAEIQYNRYGDWSVNYVSVEGFGERDANGKRDWPQLEAPAPIANIIRDRLENQWYGKVCDALGEQFASDREAALDERADRRRDERMGL
jgi:hypothetical protein